MTEMRPGLLKAGQGGTDRLAGSLLTIHKLGGDATDGAFALAEHILEPRCLAAPVHTHTRENEASYILEGRFGFMIGEEVFEAGPGDFVFKPKGVPHTFWNGGEATARLVEIFSPAGFETYFSRIEPLIPEGGEPDLGGLMQVAAEYGLQMQPETIPQLLERFGLRMAGMPPGNEGLDRDAGNS
ncbi:MAG: cupin domain-containing protein [Actinobacteria bacterium]|nr:cupin domain-containing protein [Actinomycetota bacterium]